MKATPYVVDPVELRALLERIHSTFVGNGLTVLNEALHKAFHDGYVAAVGDATRAIDLVRNGGKHE